MAFHELPHFLLLVYLPSTAMETLRVFHGKSREGQSIAPTMTKTPNRISANLSHRSLGHSECDRNSAYLSHRSFGHSECNLNSSNFSRSFGHSECKKKIANFSRSFGHSECNRNSANFSWSFGHSECKRIVLISPVVFWSF